MSSIKALKLTPRQVIAFTLRRQYLIQPAEQPLEVARRLIAIQAQYAASVPLAIWTRSPNLSSDWVKAALSEKRTLVKTWCLRGTVHILASTDLAMMVQAVGEQHLRDYEYFMKTRRSVDRQRLQGLNKAILRALAQRPLRRSELHGAVPELASVQGASWGLDVKGLAFTGALVLAHSDDAETSFARREEWLPELPWEPPSQAEAGRELLLRYLAAYGPATMQDFAHWCGLKMKTVQAIFGTCTQELVLTEVVGRQGKHYLCRQDEPLVRESDEVPPRTCLLPKFDPLLMGYKRKTRFIDEENLSRVYRPAGQVEAIILLQGRAAATWRASLTATKLCLTITPFWRLTKREQSQINNAAEQLANFLGTKRLDVIVQP